MSQSPPAGRLRATYRDIVEAPAGLTAEIVDGALRLMPRPKPRHLAASSRLSHDLMGPFDSGADGPGGWWIFDKPEVHFSDGDVFVPDLAGWRKETLPVIEPDAQIATRPDWVCEVLSPSTRRFDLIAKREIYARHGVPYLWYVDPGPKTFEALRLVDGAWEDVARGAGAEWVRAAPFEAVAIALGDLWLPEA